MGGFIIIMQDCNYSFLLTITQFLRLHELVMIYFCFADTTFGGDAPLGSLGPMLYLAHFPTLYVCVCMCVREHHGALTL